MGTQQEIGKFKAKWAFKLNKVYPLYSPEDRLIEQAGPKNTLPEY